MAQKMKLTMGERLNIRFTSKIKLEFHGAKLTSDGGLLAYQELDEPLGLINSASTVMTDKRTGRNIQHDMINLLRQSGYSRLAGYEDVNDAQPLALEVLQYTKQQSKIGLRIYKIQTFLFHEVDMGNIYSNDSTFSDKTLNIRARIKV